MASTPPFVTSGGQPFFVIGVYDYPGGSDVATAHLEDMCTAGLNTIHLQMNQPAGQVPWGEPTFSASDLDTANGYGMKVVAGMYCYPWNSTDCPQNWIGYSPYFVANTSSPLYNKIMEIKNKPALLMYETQDEAGFNKDIDLDDSHPYWPDHTTLRNGYLFVRSQDSSHPIWYNEVAYTTGSSYGFSMSSYRSWKDIGDIYSQDVYPVSRSDNRYVNNVLSFVPDNLDWMWRIADADNVSPYTPTMPLMMVLQGCGGGTNSAVMPDYIETRFMAYSSIMHGARGLMWWGSWYIGPASQLWADIKRVAGQIRDLQNVLVTDKIASKINGVTTGSVTLANCNSSMEAVVYLVGSDRYCIVANKSSYAQNSVRITVPNWNYARNGNNTRVLFEAGTNGASRNFISTSSTTWQDSFGPWEVHVYTDKLLTRVKNDFDGDGKTDVAVYTPSDGKFTVKTSSTNYTYNRYYDTNRPNWTPVSGDWDGDGKADCGLWNPSGAWFDILLSSTNYTTWLYVPMGPRANWTPVTGDWDGDRRTDCALWNPAGSWFDVCLSSSNFTTWYYIPMGSRAYWTPVAGDWDGDGRADCGLWYPAGAWFDICLSANNYTTWYYVPMGSRANWTPVAGSYDGDSRSDCALYNPADGVFDIKTSASNYASYISVATSRPGRTPVCGNWDGDSKNDCCVYTPSNGWFDIKSSSSNFASWLSYPTLVNATPVGGDAAR